MIMKTLQESLFDVDLTNKKITLYDYFDIYINRHRENQQPTNDDKKIIKDIEKDIRSINLNEFDCVSLIKELCDLSRKYTKKWHGGGYRRTVYNKSGRAINLTTEKNIDLLNDVSKISLSIEDWDAHRTICTYFILKHK